MGVCMHMQHACLGVTTHSRRKEFWRVGGWKSRVPSIVICMKPRFNLQRDSQDDRANRSREIYNVDFIFLVNFIEYLFRGFLCIIWHFLFPKGESFIEFFFLLEMG